MLPIAEGQLDYARQVARGLKATGLRAEVDDSNETLGKKVRSGKTAKVPYLVVVGAARRRKARISVEGYHDGKLADITTLDQLAKLLRKEIDEKVAKRK